MSKTKQVLILAIIAAAVIAGRAIPINLTSNSSVRADQGAGGGVQRWEYCAITGVFDEGDSFGRRGKATIRYFNYSGVREETVEFVSEIGKRNSSPVVDETLSKTIAKLGNEGWEMVLKQPDFEKYAGNTFYFKRPKQ